VFEVDEPNTQDWKRHRLQELGFVIPPTLHFVPVDFESGESWVDKTLSVGLDATQASFVSCLGVTQYITKEATLKTMQLAASLGAGTTFACTFVLPAELIDRAEFDMRAATEQGAASRGHPWVSFFTPREFLALARQAGFDRVQHISGEDLTRLYFADRDDGLRPSSSDHLIIATRYH
jgi:methyltransferase (TIGR00027 family)